jgi:mRNA interferase HigB
VNVIARATLVAFAAEHAETAQPLSDWYRTVRAAKWQMMNDVVQSFPRAKALNGERARFEICGGNYRLIVAFKFSAGIAWIKFIGSHAEYDRIDALTVSQY